MKLYYIDSGGIPCDIRKPYPHIVTLKEAVELLNQLTDDLEAAQVESQGRLKLIKRLQNSNKKRILGMKGK